MFSRIRRFLLLVLPLAFFAALRAESSDAGAAEAERLYARANDYVTRITEKGYSYSYIQFYWKRAQSNLDRIARVYPNTPTGRKVRAEEVKIGPFELTYFKERVLPRLEEKRLAAFDPVNCAIFLYTLDEQRWDQTRLAAFESIIEVLSRQQRWSEALAYPILDEYRPLLLATVFRVAARYQQAKLVDQLIAGTAETPDLQARLWPILGEAKALVGDSREEIAAFLDEHPQEEVRLAVLSGMIDREVTIQRAATLKLTSPKGIPKTHYSVMKLDVRDDVESVARTFFPTPTPRSEALLAKYRAALGQRPASEAAVETHLAYLESLAIADKIDELGRYIERMPDDSRRAGELKAIELYGVAGYNDRAEALLGTYIAAHPEQADLAVLARFRGQAEAFDKVITVRERTFSSLPIKDPCIMAQAIMYWALTPNRSIRGASPWDSVVQKYLPGFEDLPLPKSKDVQDAASTSKPF